jgi:NADH-quinone oxidoreductase subunit L
VTAGFYSKDAILWGAWSSPQGGTVLWAAGLLAAVLTGIYIFRPFIIVFLGPSEIEIARRPRLLVKLAVVVLAFFAITAGVLGVPAPLGNFAPLRAFLGGVFGMQVGGASALQPVLLGVSAFASLLGIGLATLLFSARPAFGGVTYEAARRFLLGGMGFDWVYDRAIVRPYVSTARALRDDVIDAVFTGLAVVVGFLGWGMSAAQTGRVRNYATGLALGAAVVVFVLIFGR